MESLIVVWCVINLIGVVIGLVNVRDAELDIKALNFKAVTNGRRAIARTILRAQILRTTQSTALLIIGLLALFQNPARPLRTTISIFTLIGVVLIIAVNGLMDKWAKGRLLERIEKGQMKSS